MQKLLLPLALAALLPVYAFAQTHAIHVASPTTINGLLRIEPTAILTLPAALDLALQASPELAAAGHEIDANNGAVRQAGIIPNPELSAFVEDTQKSTRTSGLQLNIPIELGGKRSARVRAASYSRDIAVVDLAAKRIDIRAAVTSAFFDVLVAQERYSLTLASVELARRASDAAARRVAAGKVAPVEETKARIAQSAVQVEMAQATSGLTVARRQLAAIWGSAYPHFERVESRVDTLPAIPSLPALTDKLEQSAGFVRAQMEVDQRGAVVQLESARRVPDITVSVGAQRNEELGRNQALLGVSIPLPFFDRNQGNLQEALGRADKAKDELLLTRIRLTSELAQAHERLRLARYEADVLQSEILPGAQSAYDAATKGFEFGKFSFLEVLDAQRTFFQAKSQYLLALSQAHRAAAELDRIAGSNELTTGWRNNE